MTNQLPLSETDLAPMRKSARKHRGLASQLLSSRKLVNCLTNTGNVAWL